MPHEILSCCVFVCHDLPAGAVPVKPRGKSFLAITFRGSEPTTALERVRFSLDSHGEVLSPSGFRDPEMFFSDREDPKYYELQVRPIDNGVFNRLRDGWLDAWNSDTFITKAEIAAKVASPIFAVIFAFTAIYLGKYKDELKEKAGRSITHLHQRSVAEYLVPLVGQEITLVVPSKIADAEAANYGDILSEILVKAGWKVAKFQLSEPIRALALAGIKVEQIHGAVGFSRMDPDAKLSLLIGRAP